MRNHEDQMALYIEYSEDGMTRHHRSELDIESRLPYPRADDARETQVIVYNSIEKQILEGTEGLAQWQRHPDTELDPLLAVYLW
jgi:hypothetical protein